MKLRIRSLSMAATHDPRTGTARHLVAIAEDGSLWASDLYFNNKHPVQSDWVRLKDIESTAADTQEGTCFWCEPCGSYHVDPVSEVHHAALMCKAPWKGGKQ